MKYKDLVPPERWPWKFGKKDSKNLLIVKKIELLNKPYFLQKRKQFFCVNLFSNTQKQNDES